RLAGGTGSARTPTTISPLASPEAPARLARQQPFHRSPRRRHRLGSHAHNPLTARLAGGTGSARPPTPPSPLPPPPAPPPPPPTPISPLASPEAPARLARPNPFHRSPRRRHRLGSHAQSHFTARLAGGTGSARTTQPPLESPVRSESGRPSSPRSRGSAAGG